MRGICAYLEACVTDVSSSSGRLCLRWSRMMVPGNRDWPISWSRWSPSWAWRAEDRISQSALGDPSETEPCLSEDLSIYFISSVCNLPTKTSVCIILALLHRRVEMGTGGCQGLHYPWCSRVGGHPALLCRGRVAAFEFHGNASSILLPDWKRKKKTFLLPSKLSW